jgi:hypothetical protein
MRRPLCHQQTQRRRRGGGRRGPTTTTCALAIMSLRRSVMRLSKGIASATPAVMTKLAEAQHRTPVRTLRRSIAPIACFLLMGSSVIGPVGRRTRRTSNRSGVRTPTPIDADSNPLRDPASPQQQRIRPAAPTGPYGKFDPVGEGIPFVAQFAIARQVTSSNCGSPCEYSPTAAFTRAITSAAFAPVLRARRSRRRCSPNWRASASAASVTPSV